MDSQKIQFHILLGFLRPPVLCRFPLNIRFTPLTSPFAFFSIQINSSNIFKQFLSDFSLNSPYFLSWIYFSFSTWRFLEFLAYQKLLSLELYYHKLFQLHDIANRKFLSFRTSLPESFLSFRTSLPESFELQNIAIVYSMLFLNNKIIVWLFYITSIGFF